MDYALANHKEFIGRPAHELPTPALLLSQPILEKNIKDMLHDVSEMGISFRPHVKTLKSLEVSRLALGGKHRKVVASTLAEIQGILPLAKEGVLDEALYGVPFSPSALPRLEALRQQIGISLMVDNYAHIIALEEYNQQHPTAKPWPFFIKIDIGYGRAGVPTTSESLRRIITRLESSSGAVALAGFYCHAGHSYGSRTPEDAAALLESEVEGALAAVQLLKKKQPLVVSVGATPTAHVVRRLRAKVPEGIELELHAGNFVANDLQQVSTGLVTEDQQALRVLVDVASIYPERNEALINAGCIALTREVSEYQGHAKVVGHPGWHVIRVSQEHGIIGLTDEAKKSASSTAKVEEVFKLGQKLTLYINHACIVASNAHVYFVVDKDDVVRDAYIPWKGW